MKRIALVLIVALALLALGASGNQHTTDEFHGDVESVTGASTKVQTVDMKNKICTGWLFWNIGDSSLWINPNNDSKPAVANQNTDQIVLAPGEWIELWDHQISQFKHVSDATSSLKWHCTCSR